MIWKLRLKEPKAREIIDTLCSQYSWRFTKIVDDKAVMRYNYYDGCGFEYNTEIFIRVSKDNSSIFINVNKKKDLRGFAQTEEIEQDIVSLIRDYIEDVEPHITC